MLLPSSVEGEVGEAENDAHQETFFIFYNEIWRANLQSVWFPGRKEATLCVHSELAQRETWLGLAFASVPSHTIMVLVAVPLL